MVPKASPLVSKTRFRGIPSGSHVFRGSFECPVPTSVSGLFMLNIFCPKGVSGGISNRSGVRFPAHDPFTSWTGAGPPGVGSGFNLFPLYKLSFDPGLGAWASATAEKASTATNPIIDRTSHFRIPILASRLEVEICSQFRWRDSRTLLQRLQHLYSLENWSRPSARRLRLQLPEANPKRI